MVVVVAGRGRQAGREEGAHQQLDWAWSWVDFPFVESVPRKRTAGRGLRNRGGQLQWVLMRPTPRLSVKTCGGGEDWQLSRGGGGGCARPTTTTCIPQGCVCVCLGAWGYRGPYAIIAISCLCREESLRGLEDQRHSTPFNEAWDKNFGTVGAMPSAPLSVKTRGGGVAYKDWARPPPPPPPVVSTATWPGLSCRGLVDPVPTAPTLLPAQTLARILFQPLWEDRRQGHTNGGAEALSGGWVWGTPPRRPSSGTGARPHRGCAGLLGAADLWPTPFTESPGGVAGKGNVTDLIPPPVWGAGDGGGAAAREVLEGGEGGGGGGLKRGGKGGGVRPHPPLLLRSPYGPRRGGGGRGGGVQGEGGRGGSGEVTPPPPTVYGRSNTSLAAAQSASFPAAGHQDGEGYVAHLMPPHFGDPGRAGTLSLQ